MLITFLIMLAVFVVAGSFAEYDDERCIHRDHVTDRRCWRRWSYDRYCPLHNTTCFRSCEPGITK